MASPPDRAFATERTALGWQRSALTLAVIGGLALSSAVRQGSVVASALGAALLAAAGAIELRGRRLYRARRRGAPPLARGSVRTLTAFSLAAVAVAVAVTVSGG